MARKRQGQADGEKTYPLALVAEGVVRTAGGREVAVATSGEDAYGLLARMVRCANALEGFTDAQVERREFMHGNITVNGQAKGHANQIIGGKNIRAN
jgi:hypothetical protein